jgi:argininosuccinate lyase
MSKPRRTKLPVKKPWSGRFRQRTARSVEAFTESVSFDRRLWRQDIAGSIAHARMLARQGIISRTDERAVLKGLREIAGELDAGTFRFDPALEDVHMNIEAALRDRAGPAGAKLHAARSRNDQVALDLRLYVRDEGAEVEDRIRKLERALLDAAERHHALIMPGYTHLQLAQPVLLAHHLLAYVEMLERDRERLRDCLKRANVMPLGAAALAGTSLPIERRRTARELGFAAVSPNSMDAVSDRDFAVEFASVGALIMMHLSRLSEELVLWASEEFSFIRLPDAYATGSSIMPQKKNPDVPELVRGKTGRVYGNLMALLTILKGLPLTYNRDLQEDKPPLFDTVDTVKGALGVLAEMIPHVVFNEARMYEAAGRGYAAATDVAEYLVDRGVPFREAHEATGRLVSHAISTGKGLVDLTLKDFKRVSPRFEADVLGRLSPEASVRARTSEGGTAPAQVGRAIRRLKKRLAT